MKYLRHRTPQTAKSNDFQFINTQRSVSKGSFIHLAPPSPSTPHQPSPGSDSHQQPSPCPSIDDMLDSAAEENQPTAAVLNPEPLWQLEFGSCWHRMQSATSPVTSNPRDFIVDIEESCLSSVSSSSGTEAASSKRKKMRAMSLDIVGSRRQAAASASLNGASKSTPARSPAAPYNPDWEILMLAESMDKEDEDEFSGQPLAVRLRQDEPAGTAGASAAVRRRRSLRSSTSVDPQSMSSAKSKKMIEKWYWSYPPPVDEATDFPAKSDGGNK